MILRSVRWNSCAFFIPYISLKFHGKEKECDRIEREGQARIDTDLISFIRQLVKRATIPTPGKNYGSVSKLRAACNVALRTVLRCGLLLRLVVAVSWVRRLLGRGLDRRWREFPSARNERARLFLNCNTGSTSRYLRWNFVSKGSEAWEKRLEGTCYFVY